MFWKCLSEKATSRIHSLFTLSFFVFFVKLRTTRHWWIVDLVIFHIRIGDQLVFFSFRATDGQHDRNGDFLYTAAPKRWGRRSNQTKMTWIYYLLKEYSSCWCICKTAVFQQPQRLLASFLSSRRVLGAPRDDLWPSAPNDALTHAEDCYYRLS